MGNMFSLERVAVVVALSKSGVLACSYSGDCPVHQYCDYAHNCYHCDFLTEKCDAVDGDC